MKKKMRKKRVAKFPAVPPFEQTERPKPAVIVDDEGELGKLYLDFELDDNNEINDIVSGRIGEIAVEW